MILFSYLPIKIVTDYTWKDFLYNNVVDSLLFLGTSIGVIVALYNIIITKRTEKKKLKREEAQNKELDEKSVKVLSSLTLIHVKNFDQIQKQLEDKNGISKISYLDYILSHPTYATIDIQKNTKEYKEKLRIFLTSNLISFSNETLETLNIIIENLNELYYVTQDFKDVLNFYKYEVGVVDIYTYDKKMDNKLLKLTEEIQFLITKLSTSFR